MSFTINKQFKSLLKEYETELYSTYSDLKALFIERLRRTLLNIINKPMFINGDGNWVNILNDAVMNYNNNIHSTINLTPVDTSNNPDRVKFYVNSTKATPKGKPGYAQPKSVIMSGMQTNVTFSLTDTLLIGIENCLK